MRKTRKCVKRGTSRKRGKKHGKKYGKKYRLTKKHGGGLFGQTKKRGQRGGRWPWNRYIYEKHIIPETDYQLLSNTDKNYINGKNLNKKSRFMGHVTNNPNMRKYDTTPNIFELIKKHIIDTKAKKQQAVAKKQQAAASEKKAADAENVFRECMNSTRPHGIDFKSKLQMCSLRADVSAGTAKYPTNSRTHPWSARLLSDATVEKYKYDGIYPLDLKAKSHIKNDYDIEEDEPSEED